MIPHPRFHLFEIEDPTWGPEWVAAYLKSFLIRLWRFQMPLLPESTPIDMTCNLILKHLPDPSSFAIVDLYAGTGELSATAASRVNMRLQAQGKSGCEFVLADKNPHVGKWAALARQNKYISYIESPIDSRERNKLAPPERRECRIFNKSFGKLDDVTAASVLGSALDTADSFIILESAPNKRYSLLSIFLIATLNPIIFTLTRLTQSTFGMILSYAIPIVLLAPRLGGLVLGPTYRKPKDIERLLRRTGLDLTSWNFKSGEQVISKPSANINWYIGIKNNSGFDDMSQ